MEFTCDGTSLGSAAVVSSETGYSAVLTYDTTKKGLTIGANTVTAVYSGGDSLNGEETRFTVTVSPEALSVTGVNTTDRDYNGADTVTITGVSLGGVLGNDLVSVSTAGLTATLSSANVGTYRELTLSGTAILDGADKDYYTLTLPESGVTVANVNNVY